MATIDYQRMSRVYPSQKRALSRATSLEQIEAACISAVEEWEQIGCWPDSWADWQRKLDDARPWREQISLHDLHTQAGADRLF